MRELVLEKKGQQLKYIGKSQSNNISLCSSIYSQMVMPFSSLIALFSSSCTGDFSGAFSSFGLTCSNLSTFPLIILCTGFVISVLIVSCCGISSEQPFSGESCSFVVTVEFGFCTFLLLGVPFWFLGARLEPLLPLLLLLSLTWVLLKQLAMTNGVGLHLNSSFLASSLHGNSSSNSWSQYRSFRFGRFVPSQPL